MGVETGWGNMLKREQGISLAVYGLLILGAALRLALYWINPPANSFDDHFEPIKFIMNTGSLPGKSRLLGMLSTTRVLRNFRGGWKSSSRCGDRDAKQSFKVPTVSALLLRDRDALGCVPDSAPFAFVRFRQTMCPGLGLLSATADLHVGDA